MNNVLMPSNNYKEGISNEIDVKLKLKTPNVRNDNNAFTISNWDDEKKVDWDPSKNGKILTPNLPKVKITESKVISLKPNLTKNDVKKVFGAYTVNNNLRRLLKDGKLGRNFSSFLENKRFK